MPLACHQRSSPWLLLKTFPALIHFESLEGLESKLEEFLEQEISFTVSAHENSQRLLHIRTLSKMNNLEFQMISKDQFDTISNSEGTMTFIGRLAS